MINYITRVRVGCRAVFTFGLTTIGGVEGVVVVGHRWGGRDALGWSLECCPISRS